MRALLLSAYDAPSHRYWHQTLSSALTAIDWTTLSLPARYFNWRIRSNSLYWAHAEKACLQQPWDFLLATSMVDLTGLRALLPSLAQVPTADRKSTRLNSSHVRISYAVF